MWKPGTAKPQKQKKKPPGRNNSRKNGSSPKVKAEMEADDVGGGPASGPSAEPTGGPPKKLSGAVMNMKFMNRRTAQQPRQNIKSPEASIKQDGEAMDIDSPEMEARSPLVVQNNIMTPLSQRHLAVEDSLVDLTPASSSDMYGISVAVIGRRSFGGFNRPMEDVWKASYRAQTDQQNQQGSSSKSTAGLSDEQLLERYANLAKQRHGGRSDDASRHAVGNLGDKTKTRKKMNNNSGEKRKRR